MGNARHCGCDPDEKWWCRDYPDCVYGVEISTYAVEIRTVGTDEVVRSLPASTERAAEKIERGVDRNLHHDQYYTQIVTVPPRPTATG